MAQLTVRETIEYHVGLLRAFLEAVPTPAQTVKGAPLVIDQYEELVSAFWEDYGRVSQAYGTKYYWSFCQAAGEHELRALAYYAQDMWPDLMKDLSRKMGEQSVDVLYLITDEAGMPQEYMDLLGLPT